MNIEQKVIPETVKAFTAGLLERSLWSFQSATASIIPRATITLRPQSKDTINFIFYFWKPFYSLKNLVFRGPEVYRIASNCLPYLITKKRHALIFLAAQKILLSGTKKRFSMKLGEKKYTEEAIKNCFFLNDILIKINSEHPGYLNRVSVLAKNPKFYDSPNLHNDNIFDFFDGSLSQEETIMAKSIFDDLL